MKNNLYNRDRFTFQIVNAGEKSYYSQNKLTQAAILAGGPSCETLKNYGYHHIVDEDVAFGFHDNTTFCLLNSEKMDY